MIRDIKKMAMTAVATVWLCTAPPANAQFSSDAVFLLEIITVLGTILTESQQATQAAETFIKSGAFGEQLQLLDDINGFQELLREARRLSFDLENIIDELDVIFPEDFEDFDLAETIKSAKDVTDTTRESVERLLALGAETVESQAPAASRVASDTRVGSVGTPAAALQALVRIQGEQFSQNARIQAALVTQGRVLGLQALESENAKQRAKRILVLDDPTVFATDAPGKIRFGSDLD